ncbi:hypothetical protein CCMSSC00406_0006659 [Pleurotus cornucopiae]|uniref:Uncharacterized protein n=1 Tax=Pleurotus cornucopiae TaxID=5321 RepID=A0ACB7IQB9_PLECO|nr:hypothetical protein CCMSSC00406_0006659 [Pleurotus cornucopiae]
MLSCVPTTWNRLSAWIQVTHVCRSWRAFALNEPRLWTNLVAVSPDWLTDVLSRSKSAPLRLRFSDGTRYSPKYIELLNTALTSPERIEHLEIRSDSDLLSSFTKPAPVLESLEIRSNAEFPPDFLGASILRGSQIIRHGSLHLHHLRDITVDLGDKCEAMAPLFDFLVVDSIHTLETIWPQRWVEIGTLRPVCHFFATYYGGPDLHVLRCTDRDTQFSISLDLYTMPALSFKERHPRALSDFMRLLPCCTPRILDTNITATNVDSSCLKLVQALHHAPIEELHVVSSTSVPNPSYPFLRRLHIKGLDDYDLVPRLKRWIAVRRSVACLEHLVIKGCDFLEEEIESLQKIPSPTVVTILP